MDKQCTMVINKNCGIYKITSPTGRVYVGQSKDIKRRFKEYNNLKCKKQPALYNSLVKHRVEKHQFHIIEYCNIEELNCSERFWQDEFKANSNGNLNCTLTECGNKRQKKSDTFKRNMSGENHFYYGKFGVNTKSIEVIDIVTKIRYVSIGEASNKLDICKSKLKSMLRGDLINTSSLRYAKDFDNGFERPMKKNHNLRPIIDTQTLQVFISVKEASCFYNFNSNTLSDWLNGKYENKSNLVYVDTVPNRKTSDGNCIKIKDVETNIIYESISNASKELNINICTIRYRLKNNIGSLVKL